MTVEIDREISERERGDEMQRKAMGGSRTRAAAAKDLVVRCITCALT